VRGSEQHFHVTRNMSDSPPLPGSVPSNRLAPSQATVTAICDIAIDMLNEQQAITADDVIFDVGCGKGAFLLRAAERTNVKQLVGIEYDPHLVSIARQAAFEHGYAPSVPSADPDSESGSSLLKIDPSGGRVLIHHLDALQADLSTATVMFLYLVPDGMKLLAPRILPLLKAGKCRIITNAFSVPGCTPVATTVYKYIKVRLYTAASVPTDVDDDHDDLVTAGAATPANTDTHTSASVNSVVTAPTPADRDISDQQLQNFIAQARAASKSASKQVR